MKKSKARKIADHLNDVFAKSCDAAFKEKFGVEIETTWNIFTLTLVSTRRDEKPMTRKQHAWVGGYGDGYSAAMDKIAEHG